MKTFSKLVEDQDKIASARKHLQKTFKATEKGQPHVHKKTGKPAEVSFTHSGTGKKVTGHYHGISRLGAHSYAKVEPHKGQGRDLPNMIPLHHIHH